MSYVGFVGDSLEDLNERKLEVLLELVFNDLDRDSVIICNPMNNLFSKMVYEKALDLHFFTCGIVSSEEYELRTSEVDFLVVLEEKPKEIEDYFLNFIDVLYKIGIRNQNEEKILRAKDMGIITKEYKL